MVAKIAEVRINKKAGIVQIKMNKGPNHVVKGEYALGFQARRNYHMTEGMNISDANMQTASEYIEEVIK